MWKQYGYDSLELDRLALLSSGLGFGIEAPRDGLQAVLVLVVVLATEVLVLIMKSAVLSWSRNHVLNQLFITFYVFYRV